MDAENSRVCGCADPTMTLLWQLVRGVRVFRWAPLMLKIIRDPFLLWGGIRVSQNF